MKFVDLLELLHAIYWVNNIDLPEAGALVPADEADGGDEVLRYLLARPHRQVEQKQPLSSEVLTTSMSYHPDLQSSPAVDSKILFLMCGLLLFAIC